MRGILLFCMAGLMVANAAAQTLLSNRLNRAPRSAALNQQAEQQSSRSTSGVQTAQKTSDPGASKVDVGGRSIEFNGASLDIVLMVYANLVGKTVLKDPSAPAATITLQPKQGQELSDEDKILAIETVLEMNGVHLEPYGEKFIRALPRGSVRKDGIPLLMDPEAELGESTRVVSLMLTFRNIALDEAQKALEGLKSDKGVLNVFERTSSILITDTEMNINRMREIARMIDVRTPVLENVFVRQIKHASAQEIQKVLQEIVEDAKKLLEKQGKQSSQVAQSSVRQPYTPVRPLPGRPGANQQAQPAAPSANESLVTSVSDADRGMIRGDSLIIADERSNKLVIKTMKSNMDFFDKVIEQLDIETTPDTVVKVYRLKYADAEDVSDMINDLIGNAASSKNSSKGSQNATSKTASTTKSNMTTGTSSAAKQSANQRSGEAKAGELSKDNTTVLADKRINGLVVMTNKELVPVIESIVESMDVKLSQVLIETVIIEVTLGDDLKTGIDWVRNGRNQAGNPGYFTKVVTKNSAGKVISQETIHDLVPEKFSKIETDSVSGNTIEYSADTSLGSQGYLGDLVKDGLWTGTTGYMSAMGGGSAGGTAAAAMATGAATNMFGSAFNYLFKSDKLNLSAIIEASKTDSRTKYIASPIVMTLDNKEATIDATSARQFVTGWQAVSSSYSGSGMPTPTYTSKDIGIKVKVTPKINPNGTVMLEVEEEYNQVGGKQTMLVPTSGQTYQEREIEIPTTRKMASDVLLENMQTVVFGGLVESYKAESKTGIPILMDIPWIGKWLFSRVTDSEARTELLVFMTPYVLDDGEAAQAEAIRRKRSMSDARPWEDNGWSLSNLADPVSKREQIRRLKEEAMKQDEERKTSIAIEQWKVERAKQIRNMSGEERNLWLEMYKEGLDEDAAKELEEKMKDERSQEELKELAGAVREKRLAEAEGEIKKMEDLTRSENERNKLEAEQAKEAKGE